MAYHFQFKETDSNDIPLTRENIVYIEAPSFTMPAAILGSQKALTIFLEPKAEIATLDKDNTRKNRTSPPVYVYAFQSAQPPLTLTLPAKIYDPKSFTHRDTTSEQFPELIKVKGGFKPSQINLTGLENHQKILCFPRL